MQVVVKTPFPDVRRVRQAIGGSQGISNAASRRGGRPSVGGFGGVGDPRRARARGRRPAPSTSTGAATRAEQVVGDPRRARARGRRPAPSTGSATRAEQVVGDPRRTGGRRPAPSNALEIRGGLRSAANRCGRHSTERRVAMEYASLWFPGGTGRATSGRRGSWRDPAHRSVVVAFGHVRPLRAAAGCHTRPSRIRF